MPKENTGNWHDDGNNGGWQQSTSNNSYDDGSWNPQKYVYPLTKAQYDEQQQTTRETTKKTTVSYDKEMIDNTIFIPNGINQWNRERYELTGYINEVNTEHTQVLMEYGTSGKIGATYEYGTQRESMSVGSKVNYYGYDGRGNVSELMNAIGGVNMSYSYGAFGKTSTKVTTYTKNSYTYNGENVDLIPGVPDLQYLRARYYDPNMGRFMQQDTLFGEMERPLTQNLYIYCLNNGVNLRDPSGNSSIADLQAQYDKAERAGAGQSVLDGIKSAMERARKAESKPTPKPNPPTKPPKKPDWGDTSNPYNPVNNPNSAGSILSGADGYWSNGGGSSSSGGGGYGELETDTSVPVITEWQRKLAEMYKNGQLGLMERAYFEKDILPQLNFWTDNAVPVLGGEPRGDWPFYNNTSVKHNGTDFPAPLGTPIYSVTDGIVVESVYQYPNDFNIYMGKTPKYNPNFESYEKSTLGNRVVVEVNTEEGMRQIRYAHQMQDQVVKVGDKIKVGDLIGYVGNTGNSSNSHLHFDVKRPPFFGDCYCNPNDYLK